MKKLILICIVLGLLGCNKKSEIIYFPENEMVIVDEFKSFSNFFPIAIINLKKFGLDKSVPLVYVFFDHTEQGFLDGDDIDHFGFTIANDGKLNPTFNASSLAISENYNKYLKQSRIKYNEYKSQGAKSRLIEFTDSPEWWQNDQTPQNDEGENLEFICQIDTDKFSEDDCRMFVFLNKDSSELRIIYQRT